MSDSVRKHWLKHYKLYWAVFLALVVIQGALTIVQIRWPWSFVPIFIGFFLLLNHIVSVIIFVLTWPAKKNFFFDRYMKILLAFSVMNFISQLIAFFVGYFNGQY